MSRYVIQTLIVTILVSSSFVLMIKYSVLRSVVKLERKEIPKVKMESGSLVKVERTEGADIKMEKNATKKPKTPKEAKDDDLPKLSAFEQRRLQNLRDNQEMVSVMSTESRLCKLLKW